MAYGNYVAGTSNIGGIVRVQYEVNGTDIIWWFQDDRSKRIFTVKGTQEEFERDLLKMGYVCNNCDKCQYRFKCYTDR